MREFSLDIPLVEKGLRPEARIRRGEVFLTAAFNVVAERFGLEPVTLVSDPFAGNEAISYPYPQLHRGMKHTLLMGMSAVKIVDETTTPWTAATLTLNGALDRTQVATLAGSGLWHVADMGGAFYLFNGTDVVFRTGMDELEGNLPKTYAQSAVTIKTGCAYRGRMFYGGFDASNFWPTTWQNIFDAWHAGAFPNSSVIGDIGPNWVGWSSIGGGDFPLWLFFPDWHPRDFGPSAESVIERLKRNEFGWMQMPWQGEVMRMLPLGGNVIVYGTGGVTALVPTSSQNAGVPPTFGMQHILGIGVSERGAAGGDDNGHVFVTDNGDVWSLSASLELSRLGYSEYLQPELGYDIVVSKHPREPHFYISSNNAAFLLTPQGMTEHKQRVTGIAWADGGTVGVFEDVLDPVVFAGEGIVFDGEVARFAEPMEEVRLIFGGEALTFGGETVTFSSPKDSIIIVTSGFDVGLRSVKTVTSVQLGMDMSGLERVEVAIDYRYDKNAAFKRSGWFPTNKEGVAFPRVSGVEFQIAIRRSSISDFFLDYIRVTYQADDRRVRRGPNVSEVIT